MNMSRDYSCRWLCFRGYADVDEAEWENYSNYLQPSVTANAKVAPRSIYLLLAETSTGRNILSRTIRGQNVWAETSTGRNVRQPHQLEGLRECCKLHQCGLGQSPGGNCFLSNFCTGDGPLDATVCNFITSL